jgi:hypothetical protein
MRIIVLLMMASFLVPLSQPSATIWHIEPDSTGQAINIQAGIDSCIHGDTVLVAPGIYRGDGNRDLDFRGKSILVISAMRLDPAVTDSSIINCEGTEENPHRGFYFHSGETRDAILEGLVIENGINSRGGGICCDSTSSPTIRYNMIRNCSSTFPGQCGGIACFDILTSPIIFSNEIVDCYGYGAGGILCDNAAAVIDGNTITRNRSSHQGCISYSGPDCIITNNTITDNSTTYDAGGIVVFSCEKAIIVGNEILSNEAQNAGAIWIMEADSIVIENNTISGNWGYWCCCMYLNGSHIRVSNNIMNENAGPGQPFEMRGSTIILEYNEMHYNGNGYIGDNCIVIEADSKYTVLNNSIHDDPLRDHLYEIGGLDVRGGSGNVISNNLIDGFGLTGVSCASNCLISGNTITNNNSRMLSLGGGVSCSGSAIIIESNLIAGNMGSEGAGIYCMVDSAHIIGNTLVNNMSGRGLGLFVGAECAAVIQRNIIAFNRYHQSFCGDPPNEYCVGGGIYTENPDIEISCNDVYNNEGGSYVGIPDQTGINGNFSQDPIFCDAENGTYTIHTLSPCLPQNHPYGSDCGLIGAFDSDCSYIASLLQGYDASFDRGAIKVAWEVSEVISVEDFMIYRTESTAGEFRLMAGAEITGDGTSFTWIDGTPLPGKKYIYRVELVSTDKTVVLFESDPVSVPMLPLTLHQNYPNPFNPSTRIEFYLPARAEVSLDIYDISGRLIIRLVDGVKESGNNSVIWDGSNDKGIPVSSGTYFYKLTVGKESISKKMIVLR